MSAAHLLRRRDTVARDCDADAARNEQHADEVRRAGEHRDEAKDGDQKPPNERKPGSHRTLSVYGCRLGSGAALRNDRGAVTDTGMARLVTEARTTSHSPYSNWPMAEVSGTRAAIRAG